jgi:hypothetical protein
MTAHSTTAQSNARETVIDYLAKFGPILSPSLFAKIQAPGICAREVMDMAWQRVVSQARANSSKFAVFMLGAAGCPNRYALFNLPTSLLTKAFCVYDVSDLSLSRVNDLIEDCHRRNLRTIAIYINQPLEASARIFINESALAGLIPSASEFAISHFNTYNTFVTLVARHKNKLTRFGSSVIALYDNTIHCLKDLRPKKNRVTLNAAEAAFLSAWNRAQARSDGADQSQPSAVRPTRVPTKMKTLRQAATFTAHILARNVNVHLNEARQRNNAREKPESSRPVPLTQPRPQNPGEPPAQSLAHAPVYGSSDVIATLSGWHEKTTVGQAALLESERPLRVVVQEKKTHEHEMEIVFER